MSDGAPYAGIRFPDRAEALDDFEGYRVFLDPWAPIADALKPHWEAAANRGVSHVFAIHGPQGAGKTLLTKKLATDFGSTKGASLPIVPDENNFWHRVSGGPSLDSGLIQRATADTEFHTVENVPKWPSKVEAFMTGQRAPARVLIADNAERTYFRQGLVDMTDVQYLGIESSSGLNRLAVQRLVDRLRTTLSRTLLVLLSNSSEYLLALQDEMDQQHAGLMSITNLELPGPKEKEAVIRVNTNRLNNASYWAAVDQGTPDDRVALKNALAGDATFPASFAAVDLASRNRTGRPALKNVITLVVLANCDDQEALDTSTLGVEKRTEAEHSWLGMKVFESKWAPLAIGQREAGLLESEWTLRVCVLGQPFVRSLLSADTDVIQKNQVQELLTELKTFQGPGTNKRTREAYTERLEKLVRDWIDVGSDLTAFWKAGQNRSGQYERALANLLPGYNTSAGSFSPYRPDYVISDFLPCAVSDAPDNTNDAIRVAIRRNAHVLEFTAINAPNSALISSYLAEKLPNYVEVTQGQ